MVSILLYTIVEEIECTRGKQAGIKSVTVQVKGYRAFGYLQSEMGVHRLVRQSPFNANVRYIAT